MRIKGAPARRIPLILVIGLVLALCITGPLRIGFLSDDFDLLHRGASLGPFDPIDFHHYAPVLNGLYHLTAAGILTPLGWHLLTMVTHLLNILLVYRLCKGPFTLEPWSAFTVTALFAFNPAGYEALAWACSICYPLLALILLVALRLVLEQPFDRPGLGWSLAACQFLAILVWDWGILCLPMVFLAMVLHPSGNRPVAKRAVSLMWPVCLALGLVMVFKKVIGYRAGYGDPMSLIRTAYLIVSSPVRVLLPNSQGDSFKMPAGLALAALMLAAMALLGRRDRTARLAALLYMLFQVPYALFGAVQSRYFYLPTFFMALVMVKALIFPRKAGWYGVRVERWMMMALVAMHLLWAVQRGCWWRNAFEQALEIKAAILTLPDTGAGLVIVNLTDHYGPPDLMSPPYVWRNGIRDIGRAIQRVQTPGAPNTWAAGPIPTLERARIAVEFAGYDLYEVRHRAGDWREYEVVPFKEDN
ncbi:hypothetical protein JW905_02285 [bacterium]|nr:hypothetical protein [candidate division CSSED10-310 bacterium]